MPLQIDQGSRGGSGGGIGPLLREARENASLSIEEVSWRLRMRPDVLRALEDEDFSEIGHEGFVRTQLRSYAKLLGLDAGALIRTYRRTHDRASQSPIAALDQQERAARRHLPRSRWLLAATIAAVGLVAASVLGVLRGPGTTPAANRSELPAGPRIQYEQASRGLVPLRPEEQVSVRIAAVKAAEVRVVIDGKRSFEGTLAPGASKLFTAARAVEVTVDDPRSVRIWANDAPLNTVGPGPWHGVIGRNGLTR